MSYQIYISRRAQKALLDLQREAYGRIREAIRALAADPRPSGCSKLTGREGWRIRVGDYRVIYEINDSENSVTVLAVGHRRDIYR